MLARLKTAFFRSFFRILIAFIALAEWVCVAWMVHASSVRVAWPVHVVAPLAIYQLNRVIVARRRAGAPARPILDPLVRAYVAFAFGSIFCALFLAAAGVTALAGTLVVPLAPAAVAGPLERSYVWLVHAGFATTAGVLAWGYVVGPRELGVSRIDVPVRDLPPALEGFRIVHVSDLHIGQHMDRDELAEHVRGVNALEPDLVCITGDLVDRAETCAAAFPTLGGLRARHGVLVTLGNHDFSAGADHVTAMLRRTTSFTVLRDATVEIPVGDARLGVVGVDDLGVDWARGVTEHPALPRLVAAARRPLVVLTHRPDCFPQAARLGAALVLAGHTHGGQLALPPWLGGRARNGRGRNLAELISRFDRGLYQDGDATLYVNRGLGFTAQRIRLFTPREIACLELRRA